MTEELDFRCALARWAELFNAGEYYEAHEAAEEAWHRAAEPRKTFLKGLIHAAVSLCHLTRGNAHGARVKYHSCRSYLSPYGPYWAGLDVDSLLRDLETYLAPLLAQPPGSPIPELSPYRPQAKLTPSPSR